MKRVVVTGGTGFVGASLTRRLIRDGHEVHLLVRPGHATWRIAPIRDDIAIHTTSLDDDSGLRDRLSEIRPDWIFHLAAYGAYSSQTDLDRMIQTNFVGTVKLVKASIAVGFEAFVSAGSSSEYGLKDHPPTEDEAIEPNSHYAVTKAAATMFGQLTARQQTANIATLRLYSVFGPYEEPSRLVPNLIVRGRRGELPALVNPDVARDFVFVEDVDEAFILAAAAPDRSRGMVFNVGSGRQTSLREAVAFARRALTISDEPRWGSMPNRTWDATSWVADTQRIRDVLGWRPRYDFASGFGEFVRWFGDNPAIEAFYRQRLDSRP